MLPIINIVTNIVSTNNTKIANFISPLNKFSICQKLHLYLDYEFIIVNISLIVNGTKKLSMEKPHL